MVQNAKATARSWYMCRGDWTHVWTVLAGLVSRLVADGEFFLDAAKETCRKEKERSRSRKSLSGQLSTSSERNGGAPRTACH